ncbi:MAG: tRNA (N6-isopentenyl adenosine(37)-C2)-methylthiotransferase MiaB [Desulfovibrionaceae bacterium]
MKCHIITFGCQMNVHDSDWLGRALAQRGFSLAPPEEADVVIVNTCSVREKPELKVYSQLGRLGAIRDQHNPGMFVAVGGCVAQQIGLGFWERFPFVRLVFGTDGVAMAPQAIERLMREPGLRLSLLDFTEEYVERDPALHGDTRGPAQVFVNIMQGCDNFCAYCIVPYVRGRQKSRSAPSVLDECRRHVARGAREITLLGQNVNSFGLDSHGDGTSFAHLLRQVAAIDGLERLRFTTSHPKDLADEVIGLFGELDNLCPQLHLPLQSGSDAVLAAMGRKYDTARYFGLVDKLRAARPDIELSTDLIVGFPGETDADFRATLDAMERVRYATSFSFRYSDRPGVRAERMSPKVPQDEAAARLMTLQELQNSFTNETLAAMLGKHAVVLFEGASRKQDDTDMDAWRGRDPYNHVVNVACPAACGDMTGKCAAVRIADAKKHSLIGTLEGTPW